jgi:hypothetical protein
VAELFRERSVLHVVVRLPQQSDPYGIAAHNGIEQPARLRIAPYEVALDSRKHDLIIGDLV